MSKSILLVDDEPAVLRSLQRMLQRAGYFVQCAEHGAQALQLLAGQQFALVISDFRMPGMNGAELLSRVRQEYPASLGIILSAYADREALLECLNSGAAWKFLEKPWDDQQLIAQIELAMIERERRMSEQQRTNLLLASPEPLLELSATGQVRRFNSLALTVLGVAQSELKELPLAELFDDINPIELAVFLHKKDHDLSLQTKNGRWISLSHRISDLQHYLLKLTQIDKVSPDVFARQQQLLDTTALRQHIENWLTAQHPCVVVSLMIKDYSRFADSLSEEQLDGLAEKTSLLLWQHLPSKAVIGCQSAEHFVVVLADSGSESRLQQHIDALLQDFSKQLVLDRDRVQINFSVGYAIAPADGDSARQLLHHAEIACRQNLLNPKAFYLRFDRDMVEQKRQHFEISNSLYAALEEQQFYLLYQPKVRLSDGYCDEAEVLIRWQHPHLGMISPAVFIPIAEQDGQIMAIGSWVLQACLQQASKWREQGLPIRRLAVNLSGRQLQDLQFSHRLSQLLQLYQQPASLLELEVTETFLMNDIHRSALLLEHLQELGCHLAMDDFGTGYSSLAYLAKLPVQVLKLDRSLVLDLEDSPQSASMVRHMIRMAHELDMEVVAEGIESPGQLDILRELQCDMVQGYVYSPPVAAEAFAEIVRKQPFYQAGS